VFICTVKAFNNSGLNMIKIIMILLIMLGSSPMAMAVFPDKSQPYSVELEQQALLGDPLAQLHLARAYYKGNGILKDDIQAIKWMVKNPQVFDLIYTAATEGDIDCQAMMGALYYFGQEVEQDYKKAFDWFIKAAQQNEPYSQSMIGGMYMVGQGVAVDHKQGFHWLMKAAQQNLA
jgi:TPR repeat protein